MDLGAVPRLLVVNKVDRAAPEAVGRLCDELDAIPCSAVDPAAARRVVVEIERRLATLPPTAPEPPD
jgi:50S ribosomal subunit-associated GTPase HflX